MARVNRASQSVEIATRKRGRPARPPSTRNCAIYERIRLEGENHEKVAADYAMSRQCVADIVARVESWLAAHPAHKLAQKMRVRCGKRWETLWTWAIDSFDRSRRNREFKKERTARRAAGEAELVITEQTVREQNGDPRYLNIAWRVAVREDRLWMPAESGRQPPQNAEAACRAAGGRRRGRSCAAAPARRRFVTVCLSAGWVVRPGAFGLRAGCLRSTRYNKRCWPSGRSSVWDVGRCGSALQWPPRPVAML